MDNTSYRTSNHKEDQTRDSYGKTPERRRKNRKIIRRLWLAFTLFFASIILFFVLIYHGIIGYMPNMEQLKDPADKFASIIYSADGQEIGRYFKGSGNRVYADFSDISQNVVDALIATEDSRFEDHSGIDLRALGRVIGKTIIMGNHNAGGGSTITQQLAKQLYSPESTGLLTRAMQKPVEWMIAVKLERYFSKEEILKMYLNQFDFLYNAVGIQSAAKVYFNTTAADLNIQQAAMLVGMVKNPAYYNPVRHPERTLQRRNVVFDQMVKEGYLTVAQADSLKQLPLGLDFHRMDHKEGIAPYFREELRRMMTAKKPVRSDYASWAGQQFSADSMEWEINPLFGWIEKNPKPDGTKYNLYTDGLRIHTTIDTRMQKYAEEAVNEQMRYLQRAFFNEKRGSSCAPYSANRSELSSTQLQSLQKNAIRQSERYRVLKLAGLSEEEINRNFDTPTEMTVFSYNGPIDTVMTPRDSVFYTKHFLRAGFMAMEPRTGHVKAYVGGPSFDFFQYDMVSTGRRQVGSTMKPFLYAYAMDDGYTPCDQMLNAQPTIIDEWGHAWRPRGSGATGGMVSLKWALTHSNNFISARLIAALKPATFVRYLHSFGVTGQIKPVMPLALGSHEISLKQMVAAYSTFANNGMRSDPVFVTSITDNEGNVIDEFTTHHTEVLSEKGYYKILDMLLNVTQEGTGRRLRGVPYNLTAQIGGKTGTTNFNSDSWFMAFTPELVAGTWVGGEERFIHFTSTSIGQGAASALPIYGKFIRKVFNDSSLPYSQSTKFEFPAGIDLCDGLPPENYGGDSGEQEVAEESFEGAFD